MPVTSLSIQFWTFQFLGFTCFKIEKSAVIKNDFQALLQTGVGMPFSREKGNSFSLGLRIEGLSLGEIPCPSSLYEF